MRLFKKYFLRFLKIAVSMLLIVIFFEGLKIYAPQSLSIFESMQLILSKHAMFFRIFRWLFIIIFISTWHVWIKFYARKYQWSESRRDFFLSQRWRMAVWLVVFELLVCENVLSSLFH